ncbi:hypothetical protein LQW54_000048 [Pestalotiopsis sp. IQ-011]
MEEPRNVYWVPVRRKHNQEPAYTGAAAFATAATPTTSTLSRRQVVSGLEANKSSTSASTMAAVIFFIIIIVSILAVFIWRQARSRRRTWMSQQEAEIAAEMQQEEEEKWNSNHGTAEYVHHGFGHEPAAALWNEKTDEVSSTHDGRRDYPTPDEDDDGYFFSATRT